MSRKVFSSEIVILVLCMAFLIVPPGSGAAEEMPAAPVSLLVAPEAIDLGILSPESFGKGIYYMNSPTSKSMKWSCAGPEGWTADRGRKLKGQLKDSLGYMEVAVKYAAGEVSDEKSEQRIQMTLESEGETLTLEKALPFGKHNEKIDILFKGGTKTLLLAFETALHEPGPKLSVEPFGLDFGIVEGNRLPMKKLMIRNTGKGTLAWKTDVREFRQSMEGDRAGKALFISFQNDIRGNEEYAVPGRLGGALQMSGKWFVNKGYPALIGEDGLFTFTFSGTGIALIVQRGNTEVRPKASIDAGVSLEAASRQKDGKSANVKVNLPESGNVRTVASEKEGSLKASVDDVASTDIKDLPEGMSAVVIAENLPEGRHVLNVTGIKALVKIEGVRIYGSDILTGVPGWVKIFPVDGTTRSETDYVTVTVNSENLKAGYYSSAVVIRSNGGDASVDVSLQVTRDMASKYIDIYRYEKGNDYLYTGEPEAENYYLLIKYRKQRLAFRLFREDTPGTKKFLRWYNASRGDHYYTTDPEGDRKSHQGYVLEGSIGNIGTLKILGTRELYRWQNPSTGCHFYTTDSRGEGMAKKGYRFDGIAGYVR